MELLYLLCSILSTSITSLVLSFRLLLRRVSTPRATADSSCYVSLYEGTVWHERRRPVHHSFHYPVRYALIDLDQATNAPVNHLSGDEARQISETNGPVFLLTIPPSVGYEQNPLSLYYCYDVEGSTRNLKKCIAEVTNTPWGERVSFLFNPKSDTVAKPLHVSPFMDMFGSWTIKTNAPEDNLSVAIAVQHPELGDYFTATLRAKRTSTQVAGDPTWFFWLMPHRVAIWIYWHMTLLSVVTDLGFSLFNRLLSYGGKESRLFNIRDISAQHIENKLYYVTINFKATSHLGGMRMRTGKLKLAIPLMLLKRDGMLTALLGEMPNGPGAEEDD